MKAIKFIFLALLIAFLATSKVESQVIDSLKLIPVNPTVSDILKIISFSTYNHSPCNMLHSNILTRPKKRLHNT